MWILVHCTTSVPMSMMVDYQHPSIYYPTMILPSPTHTNLLTTGWVPLSTAVYLWVMGWKGVCIHYYSMLCTATHVLCSTTTSMVCSTTHYLLHTIYYCMQCMMYDTWCGVWVTMLLPMYYHGVMHYYMLLEGIILSMRIWRSMYYTAITLLPSSYCPTDYAMWCMVGK